MLEYDFGNDSAAKGDYANVPYYNRSDAKAICQESGLFGKVVVSPATYLVLALFTGVLAGLAAWAVWSFVVAASSGSRPGRTP